MFRLLAQAFWLQGLLARVLGWIPSVGIHNLAKYMALKKAFYLTGLDSVEGDYLEFGVFTGSSMAAAIRLSQKRPIATLRPVRYFGFDSFSGFGESHGVDAPHPFYTNLNFETRHEDVERRLKHLVRDGSRITLVKGYFDATLKGHHPREYGIDKAAVVLVDCDTLSATIDVLDFSLDALQNGTILVLDDFFAYRGSARQGVYGAFRKFTLTHPEWRFRRIFDYGMGGVVMMATRDGDGDET